MHYGMKLPGILVCPHLDFIIVTYNNDYLKIMHACLIMFKSKADS